MEGQKGIIDPADLTDKCNIEFVYKQDKLLILNKDDLCCMPPSIIPYPLLQYQCILQSIDYDMY